MRKMGRTGMRKMGGMGTRKMGGTGRDKWNGRRRGRGEWERLSFLVHFSRVWMSPDIESKTLANSALLFIL